MSADLTTFLSYIPHLVAVKCLSIVPTYKDSSELKFRDGSKEIDKFPSAILFVDISGFTSLNEQFAKLGTGGIETVSKHINGYFSQLIEMITLHGGDVLKFAGDALIVAFPSDPNEKDGLAKAVLRTTQCALEIQSKLKSYNAAGIKLTLHIAIGAGILYTLHVGGVDNQWEFFPAGDVFSQLHDALEKSQSGEVVLSTPAWELIKTECEGREITGDWHVTKCSAKSYKHGSIRSIREYCKMLY
eukprot:TRINITY_DN6368_c0_g1_i1.p1 TRINITY_DN6368_c0_g1~~TRINITY_DN6368_c0_g1_i1.p1  ORF type:complete len:244 (-),score=45.62 TRINITY_DN6368_c0_g1_i1:873-1604(-)